MIFSLFVFILTNLATDICAQGESSYFVWLHIVGAQFGSLHGYALLDVWGTVAADDFVAAAKSRALLL